MHVSRNFTDLARLPTFDERFLYLRIGGAVGAETFGADRWMNQAFYRSREWRSARDFVIVRDNGCDLGVPGCDISGEVLVHHMEPMGVIDITHGEEWILDPEYLITTTTTTHNAIHFGGDIPRQTPIIRTPGDTKLW